jgi:hypothetical protein
MVLWWCFGGVMVVSSGVVKVFYWWNSDAMVVL